jgi:hypothetical protein
MQWGDPANRPYNITIDQNKFLDTHEDGALNTQGTRHQITNNYFSLQNGHDANRVGCSNSRYANNTFDNWSKPTTSTAHTDLFQAFTTNGGVSLNVIIENNLATNCIGTQIGNLEDQQRLGNIGFWTWRNNFFYNVTGMMNMSVHDMYFYNNDFYRCGRNSGGAINFGDTTDRGNGTNGKVFHNIFVLCGSDPSRPSQGWYGLGVVSSSGFSADYNLVVGSGAGTAKDSSFYNYGTNAHSINGQDPLFTNPAQQNFELQANSPCIGMAEAFNNLFTMDFEAKVRGLKWDIGAIQFSGAPAAPQKLRVISSSGP